MLNIKYDIVGSFLRPQEIKGARAKFIILNKCGS